MSSLPAFDLDAAHRYFAVECFNRAWDLIDRPQRTPGEDELMLQLSLSSLWHWTQRLDCTPVNLSMAYWQAARVYTLLGQVENARRYASRCLEISWGDNIEPFCLAYAYEALARAAALAGDEAQMQVYLGQARRVAAAITDPETLQQIEADLGTVRNFLR